MCSREKDEQKPTIHQQRMNVNFPDVNKETTSLPLLEQNSRLEPKENAMTRSPAGQTRSRVAGLRCWKGWCGPVETKHEYERDLESGLRDNLCDWMWSHTWWSSRRRLQTEREEKARVRGDQQHEAAVRKDSELVWPARERQALHTASGHHVPQPHVATE